MDLFVCSPIWPVQKWLIKVVALENTVSTLAALNRQMGWRLGPLSEKETSQQRKCPC